MMQVAYPVLTSPGFRGTSTRKGIRRPDVLPAEDVSTLPHGSDKRISYMAAVSGVWFFDVLTCLKTGQFREASDRMNELEEAIQRGSLRSLLIRNARNILYRLPLETRTPDRIFDADAAEVALGILRKAIKDPRELPAGWGRQALKALKELPGANPLLVKLANKASRSE